MGRTITSIGLARGNRKPGAESGTLNPNMQAHLIAVAGPLKGMTFPVGGEPLSIGRDKANKICVEDAAVSRRHCQLTEEDGGHVLRDLGSRNRTAVNGVPLEERRLEPGDEIKVGISRFLFHLGEITETISALAAASDAALAGETMLLRREDAVYRDSEHVVAAVSPAGRMARNLKALLQTGEALSSIRGLEPLARRLLEVVAEVIPARHGAILLMAPHGGEMAFRFHWHADPARTVSPTPRAILDRVLQEGVSLWSNDVRSSREIAASSSLRDSQVSAVLAVPLMKFDRVIGAFYLATTDIAVNFEEDHLQLLSGVARIAAGALDTAQYLEGLENENRRLQAQVNRADDMVGSSAPMQEVYRFIAKVAPTPTTVLIGGESGTGKELVARAIHRNSPRGSKTFAAINCAALTETLLESEMFGHEKGAFTGAVVQKKGRLEEAEGGTVFLDEIGELAASLQAKLLRVLQEREFERVGGTRAIRTDIRLVAATNRDLKEEVAKGRFRADLYYRLNVVSIGLPPLRDRREDLPALVQSFIAKHGPKAPRRILGCSEEALACLRSYDWPGNVRELENAIERAVVLGSTEWILPDDLPESIVEAGGGTAPGGEARFHETIRQMKRQLVLKAIEQAQGNLTEAARTLGLHPNNLYRLMKTLNLRQAAKG